MSMLRMSEAAYQAIQAKQADANLTLPWPPSINHYWRHTRNGHYISAEGQAYRETVRQTMALRATQALSGRVAVTVTAYPPDKRKRDLDNVLKALLDALTHGGLWADDEQIDDLRIVRSDVLKPGRVQVVAKVMA
jgi:crossover junction endodeoxyribonuclease RusA